MALKILLLEDSENDALLLRHQLEVGGIAFDLRRIDSEDDLLSSLRAEGWDQEAEEALLAAKERAEAGNRAKERFYWR